MRENECPVCFDVIKYKITTVCKHVFCDSCIMKHMRRKHDCPICRQMLVCDDIYKQIHKNRVVLFTPLIQINRRNHREIMNFPIRYNTLYITCMILLRVYIIYSIMHYILLSLQECFYNRTHL